jgi:hypothetical protein
MIAEMNKIAIIHLFLLGFEDELTNFTLGLTNPSKQSDLLGIELWKEKITLFKDAVAPIQDSVAPVSASWAKKHILGFSDDEIRLDLQQQRIERAVGEELKATPTVITKTGVFDNIDKLYGSSTGGTKSSEASTTPGGEEVLGGLPSAGGEETLPAEAPTAPEEPAPAEAAVTPESKNKDMNILIENDLIEGKQIIELGGAQESLGKISEELDKLLNS